MPTSSSGSTAPAKGGRQPARPAGGQPEHQQEVRAGWARALAGQEITVVEEFGDPSLARPYYAISFRTLKDAQGNRIGAYQFVTDVSDRLRAEAQLTEAQAALRQSQKMEAMGS
jgi:hypothetical protein